MPSAIKLLRLATLPETRHAVVAASRSAALRDLIGRARSDRAGLIRELANPATTFGLVREAIAHPATRELATVGYIALPGRYLPVGWIAKRLSRWVQGRFGDGPATRVNATGGSPEQHPGVDPPRGDANHPVRRLGGLPRRRQPSVAPAEGEPDAT